MDRYLTQETWGVDEAKHEYEHCALSHDLKQQKMKKVGLNAGSLRPLPPHTPLDKKKNRKGYGGRASQSISEPLMLRTEFRI